MSEIKVYTYEQAAEILGVGADWLQRQASNRKVPHARLGRNVRFTEQHLQQILDAATVSVIAAPEPRSSARTRL